MSEHFASHYQYRLSKRYDVSSTKSCKSRILNYYEVMNSNSGFTLLELLITVAIMAVVMAIAVPNMSAFINNDRLITEINGLTRDINYARNEAILRHTQIGICSSSNTTSCNGAAWQDGWIVFLDTNGDSLFSAGEEVLKAQQALGGTITLTTTIANTIIFDNRGFAPGQAGTFSICDNRGVSELRSISLSVTGRVRKDGATAC